MFHCQYTSPTKSQLHPELLYLHHLPDPGDGDDDIPQPGQAVPLHVELCLPSPPTLLSLHTPDLTLRKVDGEPLSVREEEEQHEDQHPLHPVHGGGDYLPAQVRVCLLHVVNNTPARGKYLCIVRVVTYYRQVGSQ